MRGSLDLHSKAVAGAGVGAGTGAGAGTAVGAGESPPSPPQLTTKVAMTMERMVRRLLCLFMMGNGVWSSMA